VFILFIELRKAYPWTHTLLNVPRFLAFLPASCSARSTLGASPLDRHEGAATECQVSYLISTHELGQLLDEEMTDKEREDLEDAEAVCRKFLQWNLEGDGGGNVKARLADVLGRKAEEDDPEE